MRFSLSYLLYAISLVAACIGLLGWPGIPALMFIASIWIPLFRAKRLRTALAATTTLILTWVLLCCLAMPTFSNAREAAHRMQCSNQLKQLTIALQQYDRTHNLLPPAATINASGQSLQSWRTLILPYLDQPQLAERMRTNYAFDQPWDSPNNLQLISDLLPIEGCPTTRAQRQLAPGTTTYLAVVGEQTMLAPSTPRRLNKTSPHLQHMIMLIEGNAPGVPWGQPQDLSFDEAVELLTSEEQLWRAPHQSGGFFLQRNPARGVAMADGSVYYIRRLLNREQAVALLSRDQGFAENITQAGQVIYRWNYGNCFRFAAFLLIAFLPTPFAIRRFLPQRDVPPTAASGTGDEPDANG
ncbi:MAG: hypothetical protein CL681_16940 [Blastopirellula sp.]|nr:hypothetical protein [Blastopirellula sp.]